MYIHDVDYSYPGGIPGDSTNVTKCWIYFENGGYNSSPIAEWLIDRVGTGVAEGYKSSVMASVLYGGWVNTTSDLNSTIMPIGTRPVFYLTSDVKLKEGTDGTKANPYILDVQDN